MTCVSSTAVFGNLVTSLLCLKRTKILKSSIKMSMSNLSNSCAVSVKAPIFSSLKTELLLYFIKIVQISPNMRI